MTKVAEQQQVMNPSINSLKLVKSMLEMVLLILTIKVHEISKFSRLRVCDQIQYFLYGRDGNGVDGVNKKYQSVNNFLCI